MRTTASIILLLLASVPAHVDAQVVRGQLLNGETGLPLEGAMIVLQGRTGELGSVLSDASGRFLIHAREAGTYTVRADRIGHASTTSEAFLLALGDTLDIRVVAEVSPVRLEGLEVSGERRCELRPEAGRAVAVVWEEARKALAASALTEASEAYRYRTVRFVRELDERGRRILSEQREVGRSFQRKPFESLPAGTLMDGGFIRTDPKGDLYFAPDAEVLLSDAFLDTHCLNLTEGRGESAGLLGVGFQPIEGRVVPEIRGVVWLDPASGELRHVDYRYENLDPALRSNAVGGRVAFRGLPDGSWIVTDWTIRMPTARSAPDFRGGRQLVLAGIREVGGEVSRVQDRAGNTVLEAERASLVGVVLDDTGVSPLAGARVALEGTGTSAVTDSTGGFRLSGLREGIYSVGFSHPRVPPVAGLPEPVEVALTRGSITSVRLVAPALSTLLDRACGEERPEGSAVLIGTVRDQETGDPLSGAVVRVLWTDHRFRETAVQRRASAGIQALFGQTEAGVQGEADATGRYLVCAVPSDHPLRLEAESGDLVSGTLDLRIPSDTVLFRQDLSILPFGTGSLVGVRLPPEALEVEGLAVEVFSRAEMDVRQEGFTGATVDRLTAEEMDELRHRTSDIVDVIQRMGSPRIRITEWGPQGFPLGFCMTWSRRAPSVMREQGGGGCASMLMVLDGRPVSGGPQFPASSFILDMDPHDIESVTVLSPVQAQFRFGIDGGNGALVIETRRGPGEGGR